MLYYVMINDGYMFYAISDACVNAVVLEVHNFETSGNQTQKYYSETSENQNFNLWFGEFFHILMLLAAH